MEKFKSLFTGLKQLHEHFGEFDIKVRNGDVLIEVSVSVDSINPHGRMTGNFIIMVTEDIDLNENEDDFISLLQSLEDQILDLKNNRLEVIL